MKPQRDAAKIPAAGGLAPKEWRFDPGDVPDAELAACVWWEYARESAFIVDTLRRYREWWAANSKEYTPYAGTTLARDFALIQEAIPYQSHVFVSGCAFDRERTWQSDDPDAPNYKHADAPPLTGSFPDPWQSLHEDERKARAHISNDKEACRLVPVKVGHWSDAKRVAAWCELRATEQHRARLAWEREHMAPGGYPKDGAPDPPPLGDLRPGLFIGAGETLLLEIAWQDFTNEEIADYFRKVIPKLRHPTAPAPDLRGHKPKDLRADLVSLAVMRLLHAYTFNEIAGAPKAAGELPECRAVWECRQFAGAKWRDAGKWYAARRSALKTFRALFPFLPKDETPRHWQSKADRDKRGQ